MGRPRTSPDDEATAERLLAAAALAFGERGYEAARLEDIAGAAGIRRASLLHHFPSKDAIYEAVIDRAALGLGKALDRALKAGGPFEQRVTHVVAEVLTFVDDHRDLMGALLRGVLRGDAISQRLVERGFVPLVERVENLAREGKPDDLQPGVLRAGLLAAFFGHLLRSTMGETGDVLWRGEAHTSDLVRRLLGLPTRPS
jgi:AcrR family transcriptional regulator